MMKNTLSFINESVSRDVSGFIDECENQFDYCLENAVGRILSDSDCDIVLLAGPSSSGKTTTAGKIAEKLGMKYASCSPFRVPIARLAAAQAAVEE